MSEEQVKKLEIRMVPLKNLHPYANNPRENDQAVDAVAMSIQTFGWKVPIVAKADGEIITGHTRYKAALKLGYETVPVIFANDLDDVQVRAYRLADNRVGELAEWDFGKLSEELNMLSESDTDIDLATLGFEQELQAASFDDAGMIDVANDIERTIGEYFGMTFVFPTAKRELVEGYVAKVGKDAIVNRILEEAEHE